MMGAGNQTNEIAQAHCHEYHRTCAVRKLLNPIHPLRTAAEEHVHSINA